MLHTTLKLLSRFNACGQSTPDGSYNKLRASLPADLTDDAPITLLHVLESNGIEDAIWALRATVEPTGKDMSLELACRAAERVLPIFEKRHPDDKRPRECIQAARAYGRGEITLDALREKRAATAATAAAGDVHGDAAAAAARKAEREAQEADYRELLAKPASLLTPRQLVEQRDECMALLRAVLKTIDDSEHWWMDCSDRGGFDADGIRAIIAKVEVKA